MIWNEIHVFAQLRARLSSMKLLMLASVIVVLNLGSTELSAQALLQPRLRFRESINSRLRISRRTRVIFRWRCITGMEMRAVQKSASFLTRESLLLAKTFPTLR